MVIKKSDSNVTIIAILKAAKNKMFDVLCIKSLKASSPFFIILSISGKKEFVIAIGIKYHTSDILAADEYIPTSLSPIILASITWSILK